jgi:hypothetical protein
LTESLLEPHTEEETAEEEKRKVGRKRSAINFNEIYFFAVRLVALRNYGNSVIED